MLHRIKDDSISIDGSSVRVSDADSEDTQEFDVSELDNIAVVEDYRIIDMVDLIIQSFFALCFSLLLGTFTLLLFVGVDLGDPTAVIRSLLQRNFYLTAFLFAGGMISPSILFLSYYRYIREELVDNYTPKKSVVKFTADGKKYEFSGIEEDVAHELVEIYKSESTQGTQDEE